MKKFAAYILSFLLLSVAGLAQDNKPLASQKADIFLSKDMLKSNPKVSFVKSFDYTPDGFVFLSTGKNFVFLGNGGFLPYFTSNVTVSCFALSGTNVLTAISGKQYGIFNEKGTFVKICDLPRANMRIAHGSEAVYVYDSQKNATNTYCVYGIFDDATYSVLARMKKPISSVYETRNGTLFIATGNELYFADFQKKNITKITTLSTNEDILSIAVNPIDGMIYFSTAKQTFRLNGNIIEPVIELGGLLKFTKDGLLVFQPENKYMCRLRNNLIITENQF